MPAVLVHVSDGVNETVESPKISVKILPSSKPLAPEGMVSIPAGEFRMGSDGPLPQPRLVGCSIGRRTASAHRLASMHSLWMNTR